MSTDADILRLRQVRHIVVLMMENRSFDHMLGYLKRAGMPEVEGLTGTEQNLDAEGNAYKVFEYGANDTAFHKPGKPLDKSLDPSHSKQSVQTQIADHNGGFVKDFIAAKKPPKERRGLPMGHYTGEHLPVYDHLARQFCVCDHWHCSVPGDTWPNRLHALAAREGPSRPDSLGVLAALRDTPLWDRVKNLPIFELEAFTRLLADRQWRWYSHDPATLRAADKRYRDAGDPRRDNFAYFDRKKISLATQLAEVLLVGGSFLDDAVKGRLRDVSWIDPNFIDLSVLDPNSNDDHPPSDIVAGQALVLAVYDALVNSPQWNDTILVITYDEHGGFYDHVPPPAVPAGDPSGYKTLGVRVPALVVGPRVRRLVCHETFDHTALMKTILLRFAKDPDAAIKRMGPRVQRSPHLGVVLGDEPRTDIPDHGHVTDRLERWRAEARKQRLARAPLQASAASDGTGHDLELSDFQQDFATFALAMRQEGLPAGQP